MFKEMNNKDLLDFCEENFCEYDICKVLKCYKNCEDEDCPLVQLFNRFRSLIIFKEYFDNLYGKGLEIAGWHENGQLESFDTFYESALED